jgi:hypothetical protein
MQKKKKNEIKISLVKKGQSTQYPGVDFNIFSAYPIKKKTSPQKKKDHHILVFLFLFLFKWWGDGSSRFHFFSGGFHHQLSEVLSLMLSFIFSFCSLLENLLIVEIFKVGGRR